MEIPFGFFVNSIFSRTSDVNDQVSTGILFDSVKVKLALLGLRSLSDVFKHHSAFVRLHQNQASH